MKALLYGAEADSLRPFVQRQTSLTLVELSPDVVICYGGDGTLLSAEQKWPGVPKVPIRNSRRGIRCIPHPPEEVIERLVTGKLAQAEFVKIACAVYEDDQPNPKCVLTAMNEFSVHMGHINMAVRFKLWLDGAPYENGNEILGDGFIVSTPFGSTAYFNQITRGVFHAGLGIAFKNTTELTSHLIIPDSVAISALVTRGPAVLAYDNALEYVDLREGDRLEFHKHDQPATILAWEAMSHPSDEF